MLNKPWITEDTKQVIDKLYLFLPIALVEEIIELVDSMTPKNSISEEEQDDYRRELIDLIYKSITTPNKSFCCGISIRYDVYHEFVMLLDGWAWTIINYKKDTETEALEFESLNHSPLV